MPDSIFSPGPEDAPVSYTVPGSSEIVPLACAAVFDGSGAGGSFKPALIFRDQSGHVIARAATDETFAAGESAEVSWFPGVKAGSGSTPAASGLPEIHANTDTFTIPANSPTFVDWVFSETNAPALYSRPGAHTSWIGVSAVGVYMVYVALNLVVVPTTLTGPVIVDVLMFDNSNTPVPTVWGRAIDIQDASAGDPKEVATAEGFAIFNAVDQGFPPFHISVTAYSLNALAVNAIVAYVRQDSPTILT